MGIMDKVISKQGFIVTIKVHGNTVVSAGDMIKLDLALPMADSSEPIGAENVKTDLYYKGTFFVKRIRHDFDFSIPRHTMRLTLVKDALPTIEIECEKCGHDQAVWWTLQTRSADEPTTQFFRCTKCEHTWRNYA